MTSTGSGGLWLPAYKHHHRWIHHAVFVIVSIPLFSILRAPLYNITLSWNQYRHEDSPSQGLEWHCPSTNPFLFLQPAASSDELQINFDSWLDPPSLSVNHRCKTDLPRNMCCQCQFETLHRFLPLLVTSTLKSVNHKLPHESFAIQSCPAKTNKVWERKKTYRFQFRVVVFVWLNIFGLKMVFNLWISFIKSLNF